MNERKKVSTTQKDLLQLILEAAANRELSKNAMDTFIVDNCKSIYLGGYETTAASAMWTLMLLATNPLWQAKARAEVLETCGGQVPDSNMLPKMKIVSSLTNTFFIYIYKCIIFLSLTVIGTYCLLLVIKKIQQKCI